MTTKLDIGTNDPARRLAPLDASPIYPTFFLALRDMREANRRDRETGEGLGNDSWIGLSLAMVVLDTLRGSSRDKVKQEWIALLTAHDVSDEDAEIIYALRCSLLHGYGPPRAVDAQNRRVVLTGDQTAHAVDTDTAGKANISVPVFCRCLVERIVANGPGNWDGSLVDTASIV